jgi:hypothetical protein
VSPLKPDSHDESLNDIEETLRVALKRVPVTATPSIPAFNLRIGEPDEIGLVSKQFLE